MRLSLGRHILQITAKNHNMKPSFLFLRRAIALSAAFALCSVAPAATIIWNGGGGANKNWSEAGAAGNWSGSAEPGASDTAFFNSTAGVGTAGAGSVNNIVDASVSVSGLTYAQTNTIHNTVISPGMTLTISNAVAANLLLAGTENDAGAAATQTSTISGAGGTLVLVSTNLASALVIRQASATAGTHLSTVDLSGLDTFNATVGRVLLAVQGPLARPAGTLILAKTNVITTSGAAPAIDLGDGASNGGVGILELGQTNALFADTITVGRQKTPGTLGSPFLIFNPHLSAPAAYIRGVTVNRVSMFIVADDSAQSTSTSTCTAAADLSGGTVDGMIDTLVIGKGMTSSGTGPVTGAFTMGAGTLDVNTLEVGFENAANAGANVTGTLNVNAPGKLVVNTQLRLGRWLGGPLTRGTGALNISGTVNASVITHGGGTSSISVAGGTIIMTNASGSVGTASAPISGITLSNSTLQLAVGILGVAPVVTSNLTISAGSTADTIKVASLPLIASLPGPNQCHLCRQHCRRPPTGQ